MDTLLKNGDFSLSPSGIPIKISGIESIIQSAIIRLTIKKGSFIYDKSLGSTLLDLDLNKIDDQTIFNIVSESLAPIHNISVRAIKKIIDVEKESINLKITLNINNSLFDIDINNKFWEI